MAEGFLWCCVEFLNMIGKHKLLGVTQVECKELTDVKQRLFLKSLQHRERGSTVPYIGQDSMCMY